MTSRTSTGLRVSAAAGLALAVAAGLAPAAQAATYRHSDRTQDVRVYEGTAGGGVRDAGISPTLRNGDLGGLTITHGATALKVATGLRGPANLWSARIVTSSGVTYRAERFSSGGNTDVSFTRGDDSKACAGLSIVRTDAGMIATIPRSCFGASYRVRVGVATVALLPERAGKQGIGVDDALTVGSTKRADPQYPTLSSWVNAPSS